MGKRERQKGARWEQEVARLFRDVLGENSAIRVSQAGHGGVSGGDVDAPPYHLECKNRAPANMKWVDTLERVFLEERDTRHQARLPVVVMNVSVRTKLNTRRRVMLTLDHFMLMVEAIHELGGREMLEKKLVAYDEASRRKMVKEAVTVETEEKKEEVSDGPATE